MAKYLDFDGVKYLWGRITDWVHSLGLSNAEIDSLTNNASSGGTIGGATFNFPKIKIAGVGNKPDKTGSYPQYYVVNGMEYVNRGYVPMLFTKRVKNSHYTHTKKYCGVYLPSGTSENVTRSSEWVRYTDIFVEVRDDDPNYPGKGMLILMGTDGFGQKLQWPEDMRNFGLSLVPNVKEYRWCPDIGKVLVPYVMGRHVEINGKYTDYASAVIYNKKYVSCFDPWLDDGGRDGWMDDPTAYSSGFWNRYRHLTFHFKFGFVENKWGVDRYNPAIKWMYQAHVVDYNPSYGDNNFLNAIPYCRYTLSDVVSNVIDIEVDIQGSKYLILTYNTTFSDMDPTPRLTT